MVTLRIPPSVTCPQPPAHTRLPTRPVAPIMWPPPPVPEAARLVKNGWKEYLQPDFIPHPRVSDPPHVQSRYTRFWGNLPHHSKVTQNECAWTFPPHGSCEKRNWYPCVDTAGASGDEKGQDVYSHPSPGQKGSSCPSVSLGRTLGHQAVLSSVACGTQTDGCQVSTDPKEFAPQLAYSIGEFQIHYT